MRAKKEKESKTLKIELQKHKRELVLFIVAAFLGIVIYIDRQKPNPQDLSMSSRLNTLSVSGALPAFFGEDGAEIPAEGFKSFFKKKVCFSVSENAKQPNDIFCALIKAGKNGKLSVKKLVNLSGSKDGDESVLAVRNNRVAWASSVRDSFKSISLGRSSGRNERYFGFKPSVKNVSLVWNGDGHLAVSYNTRGIQKKVIVDPVSAEVLPPGSELSFLPRARNSEPLISIIVNFTRKIIGANAIAWMEGVFFDAKDGIDGWLYRNFAKTTPPKQALLPKGKEILPGLKPVLVDGKFPNEGVWTTEGLPQAAPGNPVLLAKTFIRPDKERPYAVVYLLYIDTAQVLVAPVAGTEHPEPTTGVRGKGVIPPEDELRSRLLTAFSGGFQAVHGNYGMMVDGEVYLPALEGIATVCFYSDNSIKIGSWGIDVFDTPALVSFRQNLPPLITRGKYNSDNKFWGYTPKVMKSAYTWRTGLGLTADKKMIYALGSPVVAETLAAAMIQSGVVSGMQLDMNISNVTCELYKVSKEEKGGLNISASQLCEGLILKKGLYLQPHTRDFFYVVRKQ
ncbi:MAG: hypothetical protein WCI43_01790 [Candidatus Firestonebacteria bacterium]